MRISSNAHTHTQFGDGRSTAEEMFEKLSGWSRTDTDFVYQ